MMRDNGSSSSGECSAISTYVAVPFGDEGMILEGIRSLPSPKMAMEIYMDTLDILCEATRSVFVPSFLVLGWTEDGWKSSGHAQMCLT